MGSVFEVEHRFTKHRRALKVLRGEHAESADVVARFVREASAAGRIGSPHIVETFDVGELQTGEPFLVMELLRGESLSERIERARGPLALTDALEIVRQAADAVQAAHDAGIVHRDLKPDNLFICEQRPLLVKILDFGISKFDPAMTETPSHTVEGTALGTPHYMAPEQMRGVGVDAQTDVYALGVVLYECLTGKKPFDADTLPALSIAIHEGQYRRPSLLRQELPAELDAIVERAMARDKSRRFASARELEQALAAAQRPTSTDMAQTMLAPPVATASRDNSVWSEPAPSPQSSSMASCRSRTRDRIRGSRVPTTLSARFRSPASKASA